MSFIITIGWYSPMRNLQYIVNLFVNYQSLLRAILVLILALIALKTDIKSYKIPNKLNLIFIVFGLILNLIIGNIKLSLIGMLFPMILFPLFICRMMGAGDIKLFCALGSIVCFPHIVKIMAYSIIFNGIIAIIFMLVRKNYGGFIRLWNWFKYMLTGGMFMVYQSLDKNNKNIFRYAYGIVLGCIYYLVTDFILEGAYALF